MEKIEKLYIDFTGHIEIDKNDIKLMSLEKGKEGTDVENVKDMSVKEIVDGITNGLFVVKFEETYKLALDGEENIEVSEVDEDED